jgi:hypothetical protein
MVSGDYRRLKKSPPPPPPVRCACGKLAYTRRGEARSVVRRMRREGDRDPQSLGTYRCKSGNDLWHVGHVNPNANGPNLNDPRVRFVEEG